MCSQSSTRLDELDVELLQLSPDSASLPAALMSGEEVRSGGEQLAEPLASKSAEADSARGDSSVCEPARGDSLAAGSEEHAAGELELMRRTQEGWGRCARGNTS